MTKFLPVGISAIVLVTVGATLAGAADISTKKLSIKDNADPTKRQVQIQSKDAAVLFSAAVAPDTNGAVLHLYSATDDFCAILPSGPSWELKGTQWKYKDANKNKARIKDGNLAIKLKSNVAYSLLDDGTQGTVNAQVQFGNGTRFCMRCSGNKDEGKKFQGKDCAAAPCDAEPSSCPPTVAPTPTETPTSLCTPMAVILKGSLTATPGRFNYNLTLGLPGADAACNTNFAGTHACTYSELQAAEAACDLKGLTDTSSATVTSFWAIDSSQPALQQCNDDAPMTGSGLNWEYGTAHTMSRGQRVALDNLNGALGVLQSGVQCNIAGTSWVGCCQ